MAKTKTKKNTKDKDLNNMIKDLEILQKEIDDLVRELEDEEISCKPLFE